MNFFIKNLHIFRKAFLPILIVTLIGGAIDQYTGDRIQSFLSSTEGIHPSLYLFVLISIINSVVFPLVATGLAILAINQTTKPSIISQLCLQFEQLFIESLRAWGSIFNWGLFLFVPALFRHLQLIFVPFIVLLDKNYEAGKIDALKQSKNLTNKIIFKVAGIIFLFHLFIPLVFVELFDSYTIIWKTPLAAITLAIIDVYFLLISVQILFNLFNLNSPAPTEEIPT